jgi:hypothetical protein
MKRMLDRDPSTRITIEEALNHPFVSGVQVSFKELNVSEPITMQNWWKGSHLPDKVNFKNRKILMEWLKEYCHSFIVFEMTVHLIDLLVKDVQPKLDKELQLYSIVIFSIVSKIFIWSPPKAEDLIFGKYTLEKFMVYERKVFMILFPYLHRFPINKLLRWNLSLNDNSLKKVLNALIDGDYLDKISGGDSYQKYEEYIATLIE